jgi:hypothetical protein
MIFSGSSTVMICHNTAIYLIPHSVRKEMQSQLPVATIIKEGQNTLLKKLMYSFLVWQGWNIAYIHHSTSFSWCIKCGMKNFFDNQPDWKILGSILVNICYEGRCPSSGNRWWVPWCREQKCRYLGP